MVDYFIKNIVPYQDGKFEVTLGGYLTPEELSVLLLKTDESTKVQPDFGDIVKEIPQEIKDAVDAEIALPGGDAEPVVEE